ncbi:cation transporter, partial [Aliarcobacter butzleri]
LSITILLVPYLNYIAKKTNSMVIEADALHYKTDMFSTLAVLISLLLVYFTGYEIIDALIGAVIAIYIIFSAYKLIYD